MIRFVQLARELQRRPIMNAMKKLLMGTVLAVGGCLVGCSSSTEEEATEKVAAEEPKVEGVVKLADEEDEWDCPPREYSDVVAVHISYADVHCVGWTGKVFCEYDSLSWLYGPGWGTCQCYNDRMCIKRGRGCRASYRGGC